MVVAGLAGHPRSPAARSVEQVFDGPRLAPVPVRALDVLAPVVPQVTARAERRQIGRVVVGGVLVQVGAGQVSVATCYTP